MATEVDRDTIMLLFALTECGRAIKQLSQVDLLVEMRTVRQDGIEAREYQRIFDCIRLGLQMAANVSRLFWPPKSRDPKKDQRSRVRGAHLRSLVGLPDSHGLSDRTLRNHIEHLDERMDDWTEASPRPFLAVELVLYDDMPPPGAMRDEALNAAAIVYDVAGQSVQLFGEAFSMPTLRGQLEDVAQKISRALSVLHDRAAH